jgi:hypothetical protein
MARPLLLGALSDCGSWVLVGDLLGPTRYVGKRTGVGHLQDEHRTRARVVRLSQSLLRALSWGARVGEARGVWFEKQTTSSENVRPNRGDCHPGRKPDLDGQLCARAKARA